MRHLSRPSMLNSPRPSARKNHPQPSRSPSISPATSTLPSAGVMISPTNFPSSCPSTRCTRCLLTTTSSAAFPITIFPRPPAIRPFSAQSPPAARQQTTARVTTNTPPHTKPALVSAPAVPRPALSFQRPPHDPQLAARQPPRVPCLLTASSIKTCRPRERQVPACLVPCSETS